MSKELFRFLRGEINGFYLTSIHGVLNVMANDIKKFFIDFKKMQFNEGMDEQTIYNIGAFAGVFLPRLSAGEGGYGSMRMTNSKIVGEAERSERGLLNREDDDFSFVHTNEEEYDTDINTESDVDNRTSMVSNDITNVNPVKGYIPSDTNDIVTDEGDINENKILSSPPTNQAYSEYYGNNFLYIEDTNTKTVRNIDVSLFLPLYKVMQYIRYNGANIYSFCKLLEILCPVEKSTDKRYIVIDSITKSNSAHFTVKYTVNTDANITLKVQRLSSFLYIVGLKFPQFVMEETVTQ